MQDSHIEPVNHILTAAIESLRQGPDGLPQLFDDVAIALYVTDTEGNVTYFNRACIDFSGRTPEIGRDRWCVTWKLYTVGGEPLPHEECPMAVAIKEKRPVRGAEAIAERPDGRRRRFVPYPTPLFDEQGELVGAVNVLVDVTKEKSKALRVEAGRFRRMAASITDSRTIRILNDMSAELEAKADEIDRLH